jgi:hypothetical protein
MPTLARRLVSAVVEAAALVAFLTGLALIWWPDEAAPAALVPHAVPPRALGGRGGKLDPRRLPAAVTLGWRKSPQYGRKREHSLSPPNKTAAGVNRRLFSIQGLAFTSSDANARNRRASPNRRPNPNRVPNHRATPIRGASPSLGLSTRRHQPVKKRRPSLMMVLIE